MKKRTIKVSNLKENDIIILNDNRMYRVAQVTNQKLGKIRIYDVKMLGGNNIESLYLQEDRNINILEMAEICHNCHGEGVIRHYAIDEEGNDDMTEMECRDC